MGFSGWSAEAVAFFSGLQADNTKAYWTAHKAVYEESVREPMAELLGELSGEFGPGRPGDRVLRCGYGGLICWRHWPPAPWLHTGRPGTAWRASCAPRHRCTGAPLAG